MTATTIKPTNARGRELAAEIADLIEKHPEHHNQNFWAIARYGASHRITLDNLVNSCGTTACAAGWATLATGHVITDEMWTGPDEDRVPVEEFAADLLGFASVDEAWSIFHCYDDATAIARLRVWAAGATIDELYEINLSE